MSPPAELPRFYGITAATLCGSISAFLKRLDDALHNAGLQLLQVRDKGLPAADREDLARACVARCRSHGARVLINDDENLALLVSADGVHVSSSQLAAGAIPQRSWDLIGASAHNLEEAELAATELDADFLVLSPVNTTLTHVAAPPLGWDGFSDIATACAPRPAFALGGLAPADIAIARLHGAHGIAAMRSMWSMPYTLAG